MRDQHSKERFHGCAERATMASTTAAAHERCESVKVNVTSSVEAAGSGGDEDAAAMAEMKSSVAPIEGCSSRCCQ
jgi:hypothetical protein